MKEASSQKVTHSRIPFIWHTGLGITIDIKCRPVFIKGQGAGGSADYKMAAWGNLGEGGKINFCLDCATDYMTAFVKTDPK